MSNGYEYAGRDLPTGDKMAQLLDEHITRQDDLRTWREFMWSFSFLYLNGHRNFDYLDPTTNQIRSFRLDAEGNLEFQSQRLLSALDRIQGRLAGLNVRPAVANQGESLQGMRERAVQDIILRSATSDMQINETYRLFRFYLTCFGMVGLTGHVKDLPTIGLTADLEVIHPRELMPFPALAENLARKCGIVRRRYLSLKAIKRLFPGVTLNKDKIRWWSKRIGDAMPEPSDIAGTPGFSSPGGKIEYHGGSPSGGSESEPTEEGVAQLVELWLDGPRGTCARYVVSSGSQIIFDQTFDQTPVYCPVGIARCIETGSFWGAGFFDLLFSIHRQSETLKKALFNNVSDLDRYGFLVVPNGAINGRAITSEVGRSLRVVTYEPDAMSGSDFRPFALTPHTTGDFPGKVAAMADQEMDQINPHRDIVSEKGRIDSAAGLSYLDEQIQQAFTTSTDAVNTCFGTVYRALATRLNSSLLTSPRPLPVGRLTLDLAGAVIDPDNLTVSFPRNPLPDISRMTFGIKALTPRSNAARVQQAIEAVGQGLATPLQFILFLMESGLEYPIWMRKWQGPYETAIRQILMLYNDGQQMGVMVDHPHTNSPTIALELVDAFMSSPMMLVASHGVVTAFVRWRMDLLADAGRGVLPPMTPTPETRTMQAALGQMQTMGVPQGAS
jgi:hypothetical protein